MTEYKICNDCNENKPLSNFYSTLKKSKEKGEYIYYNPKCKDCAIKGTRESQEKHKEFLVEYRKGRYRDKRDYYIDKSKESHRENPDRHREYLKEWGSKNKDKLRNYRLNREQNKTHTITNSEWIACKEYFNNECAYCGLHISEHYNRFAGEIKRTDFHREHVNHEGANDLSNCVPSCKSCNSSKRASDFMEWYATRSNFDSIKLDKVLQWLSGDYINCLDSE